MDFGDFKDKVFDQKDKVKQGLSKAGDAAKTKYGHGDQIDQAEKKIDDYLDHEAAQRATAQPDATAPAEPATQTEPPAAQPPV